MLTVLIQILLQITSSSNWTPDELKLNTITPANAVTAFYIRSLLGIYTLML